MESVMSTAPVTAASAAADRILALNNIEVVYDHVILVLKGVSLDVPKGGIVALLGANGAGKSTTLKAISNLLHAERGDVTKGSIIFEGDEVQDLSPISPSRKTCSPAPSPGAMVGRRSRKISNWFIPIFRSLPSGAMRLPATRRVANN